MSGVSTSLSACTSTNRYTNVTDAGLVHLKGLTNLRDLSVRETGVTDAGVRELRLALPKTKIVRMLRLDDDGYDQSK